MNILSCISPTGLTLLAVAVSFIAIAALDSDELNVIGNLLIGIGGLMIIAASQEAYIADLEQAESREEILKLKVDLLNKEIASLSK